eukprot:g76014.t1
MVGGSPRRSPASPDDAGPGAGPAATRHPKKPRVPGPPPMLITPSATPALGPAPGEAPLAYLGPAATHAALRALHCLPALGQGTYGVVFRQGRGYALKLTSDCQRLEEAGYRRLHRLGAGPALYQIQVLASDALSWSRLPDSAGGPVAQTVRLLLEARGCDCPADLPATVAAGHCLVLIHLEEFDCDLTRWGYSQRAETFATAVLQPVAGLLQRLVLGAGLFPFDQKPANVLLRLGQAGEEAPVRRVVFTDLDDSTLCTLQSPRQQTCDAALLYLLCTCQGSLPKALWRLPGWRGPAGTPRFCAAWDVLLHEVLPRGGFEFWTIYAVDALDYGWEAYLDLLGWHVKSSRLASHRLVSRRWLQAFLYRQGLRRHRPRGQNFWEPLAY